MDNPEKHILLKKEVIINDIIKGYISDISEIGMYIHAQVEFLPAAILDLSFTINENQIKVKGFVQHIQPGVGTEIIFLNLLQDDLSHIKKFLHLQSAQLEKKSAVKKILLVDDNTQVRSAYRNKLLEGDFNVIEAQSGTEAFMRLQETNFDLVVLDLWMEGIDGFKILQLMKVNPVLKNIPVVILSARSTHADLEKAIALGAKDYLIKMTTTPLKLAEKVKKILGD